MIQQQVYKENRPRCHHPYGHIFPRKKEMGRWRTALAFSYTESQTRNCWLLPVFHFPVFLLLVWTMGKTGYTLAQSDGREHHTDLREPLMKRWPLLIYREILKCYESAFYSFIWILHFLGVGVCFINGNEHVLKMSFWHVLKMSKSGWGPIREGSSGVAPQFLLLSQFLILKMIEKFLSMKKKSCSNPLLWNKYRRHHDVWM